MRGRVVDISGERYGRLVAQEFVGIRDSAPRGALWRCICDCGATHVVPSNSLRTGKTKSCGCLQRENRIGDRNPMRRPEVAAKLTGPGHGRWRGDEIGYGAAHDRARAWLAGVECAHGDATCQGGVEAALIHGHGKRFEPGRGWYSPDPDDYMPLCNVHHVRYDDERRKAA